MSVNVVLKSVFDDKGIKQAQKSFGSIGGSLNKLGGTLAAAFSVAAVTKFVSNAVKQASDLGESINAVNVSFGRSAEGIKKLGEEASTSLGLSTQQFNQLAVGFTSFAETIAGPGGDVVGIIDDLTTRGADFASVMNLDVNEAMNVFRSGLAGETEPLRKFGIDLSAAAVNTYAYANGIAAAGQQLTEQQKVQARYGLLLQQTDKFAGDFANTSGSLANAQRILKAEFANVQAEVGKALVPALEALIPAITPIVKQLGPMLTKIFEALAPLIVTLAENLSPLLKAIEPLIDVFATVAEVVGEIISAFLPVFIKLIGIITPIIKQLVEAFLPLIGKILPVFARLIDALMPFIEILADYLTYVLIPALEFLADLIGDYLVFYLEALATAFELIGDRVEFLWDKAKPFFEGIFGASEKGLQVSTFLNNMATAFYEIGKQLKPLGILLIPVIEVLRYLSKKTAAPAIPAANSSVLDAYQYNLKVNQPTPLGLPNPLGDGLGTPDPSGVADRFAKVQKIIKKAQADILKTERDYERTKFEINREYEDKVYALRQDAAKRQEELILESQSRITSAFRSATQMSLGDLFTSQSTREIVTQVKKLTQNLTVTVAKETEKTTYASVTDIINGLKERLTASKNLLANASKLAGLGFKQTFIEQVLETGTETGNALAGAILDASPETQSELKTLFGELETVSETGADALAKNIYDKFLLATRELAKQSKDIQTELDLALEAENAILLRNLADAAYAFQTQISDIKTQFLLDLDEFDGAFAGLGNTIDKLIEKFERLLRVGKGDIQGMITAPSGDPNKPNPLENAAITEGVAVKDIRNATGIIIDELSDVKGTAAYLQARINSANAYIKLASSNAAQDASAAASIADWTKQLVNLQGAAATGNVAGTVVNINVRTDSTQSQAMVGKTIGNIVTKYVTTGGQVIVSGN